MKKIYVGIDISKEKCNLCFRSGLEIVREEECPNDVKALKKAFKTALKVLGASFEDIVNVKFIHSFAATCLQFGHQYKRN